MNRASGTPRYAIRLALAISVALAVLVAFIASWREAPHERRISVVTISQSGKLLAAGKPSGDIWVWANGRDSGPQQFQARNGALNDLQFTPDERWLGVANRNLTIYSIESLQPRVIRSDGENYGTVRFRQEGKTALVIRGNGAIETLDIGSGKSLNEICCSTIYGEVAFTREMIVAAGHWPALWETRSGRLFARLTESRTFMTFGPIGFDRDQTHVLMGSQDGRVYMWDLRSGRMVGKSSGQPGYVDTLAVTQSGWVAYAARGNAVQLWHPQANSSSSLPGALPSSNLLVERDGKSIIFGTASGTIEVWDTATGQRTKEIPLKK